MWDATLSVISLTALIVSLILNPGFNGDKVGFIKGFFTAVASDK